MSEWRSKLVGDMSKWNFLFVVILGIFPIVSCLFSNWKAPSPLYLSFLIISVPFKNVVNGKSSSHVSSFTCIQYKRLCSFCYLIVAKKHEAKSSWYLKEIHKQFLLKFNLVTLLVATILHKPEIVPNQSTIIRDLYLFQLTDMLRS